METEKNGAFLWHNIKKLEMQEVTFLRWSEVTPLTGLTPPPLHTLKSSRAMLWTNTEESVPLALPVPSCHWFPRWVSPFHVEKNVCLPELDHHLLRIWFWKNSPWGLSYSVKNVIPLHMINSKHGVSSFWIFVPKYFAVTWKRLPENDYLLVWIIALKIYSISCFHC